MFLNYGCQKTSYFFFFFSAISTFFTEHRHLTLATGRDVLLKHLKVAKTKNSFEKENCRVELACSKERKKEL